MFHELIVICSTVMEPVDLQPSFPWSFLHHSVSSPLTLGNNGIYRWR